MERGDIAWVQYRRPPYLLPVEVKITKARKTRRCDICGETWKIGDLHGDNNNGGFGNYCIDCCKSEKPKIEFI
jgi:hypothetical protein